MNIKTIISIVILISLALIAYVFLDIGKAVKINNPIETKVVDNKVVGYKGINNTEQITTKTSQLPSHIQPVEQVSDEIVSFNEQLAIDLSFDMYDEFSKRNAVMSLRGKPRQDSADVVEEINKYFENMVENQVEISDLILGCKRSAEIFSRLEKKISQTNQELAEDIFTQYYYYQGLLESNICNDIRTKIDPFFIFLKAARMGDMLSRLLLTEHLYSAIARKVINPSKYPLEYMDIRNEAISYLKILASKGVTRASVKLSHMYSSSSYFMPRDKVWEYYYSFLAKKQEGFEVVNVSDLSKLYDSLTEEQKIIVDRMTENL